jgi:hypothetical protein
VKRLCSERNPVIRKKWARWDFPANPDFAQREPPGLRNPADNKRVAAPKRK